MSIIISFRGMDARKGHLEAFAGVESAAGICRSLTIISHFASTGVVRHRFPFDDNLRFYLESTEVGSFNWRLALVGVGGPLALGLTTNGVYDLGKLALSRAIGHEDVAVSSEVDLINKRRSGDIDALVEAIEPALKKGHYGIGQTADKIVLINGNNNNVLVNFDRASKDFLSKDIAADVSWQDVSISALNVNDKTGRAYFLDLRRTIAFRIDKDADSSVMAVLSSALDDYANNDPAPIRITFKRVEAIDGRLKRIVIIEAENVSGRL